MKFYAVKKGRTPGIYRTWGDAKKQVAGFSGAEYKSFSKISDATAYLDWNAQTQGQVLQKGEDDLQRAIAKITLEQKKNRRYHAQITPKTANGYFAVTYTDGGTRNTGVYKGGHVKKTDKAAWAYQIKWGQREIHEAGGQLGATNNQMEQTALINALKKLLQLRFNQQELLFVLDSRYVLNAINKGWLASWKKRGWKRSKGELANKKEWQEIDRLLAYFPHSNFEWTKGHAGNAGNEFVDHLLNKYMDEQEWKD